MSLRWVCLVVVVLGFSRGATAAPARTTAGPLGFAMTPDAGSRLVVPLTATVSVGERRAATTITYVLRGARVRRHNDTRPLVTTYFNTPVQRARLVTRGRDVHVIVELRAASTPVWRLTPQADGTAALEIDFAAGTFATPVEAAPAPRADDAADAPAPWRPASESEAEPVPARRGAAVRRDRPAGSNDPLEDARARVEQHRREQEDRRRAQQQPWKPRPAPAPLRKPGPTPEELRREMRERKRAQREAVQRELETLGNTRGGAGTATSD